MRLAESQILAPAADRLAAETAADAADVKEDVAAVPVSSANDEKLLARVPEPNAGRAKSIPAEPRRLEVAELPPSALLAASAMSFDFGADDAGRLIAGYFVVPRPIAAAVLESPVTERPWPRSAERPPRDLIPAAEFSGPRVIPLEQVVLVSLRPVVDLAPLGAEADIPRPERPPLPLAPKTTLAGPDPQRLPELPLLGRMDEGVVSLAEDATAAAFLQSLLAPLGSLRTGGVPFLPPLPLDPLAHANDFELKNPPADNDRPARPTTPLPAPVLP